MHNTRLDPYVLFTIQDLTLMFRLLPIVQLIIMFLPVVTVFAADNPTYKEGLLTIPRVDTPEQVGKYLNVKLKPATEDTWQLLNFEETNRIGGGVSVAVVTKVEMITINSFPVQIFLKVTSGQNCTDLQANQRLVGNQFDVGINRIPISSTMACTASVGDTQTKAIPLSVYGLKAGTYSYSVNNGSSYIGHSVNGITGTFTLAIDNIIAGDTSLLGGVYSPK